MQVVTTIVREETFTFTPNDGSPEVVIMSGQLRAWLLANLMDAVIDLTFPDETLEELTERHGLETDRLASMTVMEAGEPVIVGLWSGGTHILIDGAHRRAFWAARGLTTIRGWTIPEHVWRSFLFNPDHYTGAVHLPDGSALPQRRK